MFNKAQLSDIFVKKSYVPAVYNTGGGSTYGRPSQKNITSDDAGLSREWQRGIPKGIAYSQTLAERPVRNAYNKHVAATTGPSLGTAYNAMPKPAQTALDVGSWFNPITGGARAFKHSYGAFEDAGDALFQKSQGQPWGKDYAKSMARGIGNYGVGAANTLIPGSSAATGPFRTFRGIGAGLKNIPGVVRSVGAGIKNLPKTIKSLPSTAVSTATDMGRKAKALPATVRSLDKPVHASQAIPALSSDKYPRFSNVLQRAAPRAHSITSAPLIGEQVAADVDSANAAYRDYLSRNNEHFTGVDRQASLTDDQIDAAYQKSQTYQPEYESPSQYTDDQVDQYLNQATPQQTIQAMQAPYRRPYNMPQQYPWQR